MTTTTQTISTADVIAAITEATSNKRMSAWNRGVIAYALELLEDVEEEQADNLPTSFKDLEELLLNGARDWDSFSWGGCSLIYNSDIAERLCTPSELRKTRNGERRPNRNEEWLDTQARALFQACGVIKRTVRYLSSK